MTRDDSVIEFVTVLVEEEERVRQYWREFFRERAMPLEVFASAGEFKATFWRSGWKLRFFFDQDIGEERGAGVELARFVRLWPERISTALVTAYPSALFGRELASGILDAVYSKYPAELFGERFFEMRMRREVDERGVAPVLADSIGRLSGAYQDLCAVQARGLASAITNNEGENRD